MPGRKDRVGNLEKNTPAAPASGSGSMPLTARRDASAAAQLLRLRSVRFWIPGLRRRRAPSVDAGKPVWQPDAGQAIPAASLPEEERQAQAAFRSAAETVAPQWKDWTAWVRERCREHAPDARRVLEVGKCGAELREYLEGREFHALNFPSADICRRTQFPTGHF